MLSVIVKPSYYCPLNCTHCDISLRKRKQKTPLLSVSKLLKLARQLKIIQSSLQAHAIEWEWTGGEPLCLPMEYFRKAGKIIDRQLVGQGILVYEFLQTALMSISSEYLDWFHQRLHSEVRTSIDWHFRHIQGSKLAYHHAWLKNVDVAQKDGVRVYVNFVITTEDTKNAGAIYLWLLENNLLYIHFSSVQLVEAPLKSTQTQFAQFLCDIFDITMQKYKKQLKVLYLSNLSVAIDRALNTSLCGNGMQQSCIGRRFFIEPNEECRSCWFISDEAKICDGIDHLSLEVLSSPRLKKLKRESCINRFIDRRCLQCEFLSGCRQWPGCIYNKHGNFPDDCANFRSLLTHIKKYCEQSEENRRMVVQYGKAIAGKFASSQKVSFPISNTGWLW